MNGNDVKYVQSNVLLPQYILIFGTLASDSSLLVVVFLTCPVLLPFSKISSSTSALK